MDSRADWRAEVCETEPADLSAEPSDLTESVRRRLLEQGWDMGIGLTALPLRVGRRPVATSASATYGVGLVSIPALGAVRLDERLHEATVEVVEGLLGEGAADGPDERRDARLRTRSAELAAGAPVGATERHGALRFTQLAVSDNLRLLVGMIRANRPARVMARLSRSSTAALGTGAYALSSSSFWSLAHESTWPRLVAVGALSMLIILASLVLAHGLWERTAHAAARQRVVLFNVVTITTLAIGIAALYLALFLILALANAVTIPPARSRSPRHRTSASTRGLRGSRRLSRLWEARRGRSSRAIRPCSTPCTSPRRAAGDLGRRLNLRPRLRGPRR